MASTSAIYIENIRGSAYVYALINVGTKQCESKHIII